jgi:hypothetical protein
MVNMFLNSSLRVIKICDLCSRHEHEHWDRRLDQVGQAPLMGQKLSLLNLSPKKENVPVLSACLSINDASCKERFL